MTNLLDYSSRLMICLSGDLSIDKTDIHRLRHPAVGGVILFARNFADDSQLRQLTAAVRRAADKQIVIACDQEGGAVQRFRGNGFSVLPAMKDIGDSPSATELATATGIVLAAELRAAGVDLSFAPVLDVAHGRSAIIGKRSFSSCPLTVSCLALAVTAGMKRAGMNACGKHFPGHGYAKADSHTALPVDERTLEEMSDKDLIPFARWAAAGGTALMSAHIVYPTVDKQAVTFSEIWLKKVLRKQLRYRGLIISDDLSMAGANIGTVAKRLQAALAAGCDLCLVCQNNDVDDALVAKITTKTTVKNIWNKLKLVPDNCVSIGDEEYNLALLRMAEAV